MISLSKLSKKQEFELASKRIQRLYELVNNSMTACMLEESAKIASQQSQTDTNQPRITTRNVVHVYMRAHRLSAAKATVDIAVKIGLVTREAGDELLQSVNEPVGVEFEIDAAKSRLTLVIVEDERLVYWNGDVINVDWRKRSRLWEYLIALARNAKEGRPTSSADLAFFDKTPRLSDLKYKLKQQGEHLKEMCTLIKPAAKFEQVLAIEKGEIAFF